MSNFGFPIDAFDLRVIVKSYLDKLGLQVRQFKNNLPGQEWAYSFLKRHRDISIRFASNIKRKRAEISGNVIGEYFENLAAELDGVPPNNIWNYDETNLTDEPGRQKVLTKRGAKYPERVINSTRTSISLMFCGSAGGDELPPYVVYKADNLWNSWTENGPLHARYNRSKSGWFDSTCFEDWFESLLLPHLKRLPGKKVVIGDNLSSHISLRVLELCEQHNLVFIALPPNSTHLTQPLDIAYFRPMKIAWRKILTEWKMGPGRKATSLPKDKFPMLLQQLLVKLHENGPENLRSGFRKAGIYPLDKTQVMSRLPDVACGIDAVHSEHINQSFLDYLKNARAGDPVTANTKGATGRRKKLNVPAGKSISLADVQAAKQSVASTSVSVNEEVTSSGSDSEESSAADIGDGAESAGEDDDMQLSVDPSDLTKGEYVVVKYEGALYPGLITNINKSGFVISCMVKSGCNWKWPKMADVITYDIKEIVAKIAVPKQVSNRGVFQVDFHF